MERDPGLNQSEIEQTVLRKVATSRSVELNISISNNFFTVDDDSSSLSFFMTHEQLLLLEHMSRYPEQSFLDGDIKADIPELADERIINVYKGAMSAFGAHPIRDNYIKFGSGKSSRYAHLSNSDDVSLVVKRGIEETDVYGRYEELIDRDIRDLSYNEVKLLRRLKPFVKLGKAYSKESGLHRTRNKVIGATVLSTVTIGGTIYYVHRK